MVIGKKIVAAGIFGMIFVLTLGLILGGSSLTNAMENTPPLSGDAAQELWKAVAEAGARLHWRTTTTASGRFFGYEILSFPEGTSIKEVAGAMIGAVTLSPDATQIALFDNYYPLSENMQYARDLVIENIETETREQTGLKARDSWLLAWAPDGQRLALFAREAATDPAAIWPQESLKVLIEGPRKPLRLFIFTAQRKTLEIYDLPNLHDDALLQSTISSDQIWSPDGKEIVYTATHESKPPFHTEIWILTLATRAKRFLTRGTDPTWSPTNNRIAFRGEDGNCYLINADGSGQELLLKDKKDSPDIVGPLLWSPDGRWLLVPRWSSSPEMVDLFVMDPQTKIEVRTEAATQSRFSWKGKRKAGSSKLGSISKSAGFADP